MKTLILLLTLSFVAFGQAQDLPDRGSISDIAGKTKVYIAADAQPRKWMLKKLKKLDEVPSARDADFIMEYRVLHQDKVTSLEIPTEEGVLTVYYLRPDGKKVIVWSDQTMKGYAPATLAERFMKALTPKK